MKLWCFFYHLWKRLNFCRNYGDWEHKFEHLQCEYCGKLLMHSRFLNRRRK